MNEEMGWSQDGGAHMRGIVQVGAPSAGSPGAPAFMESFVQGMMKHYGMSREEAYGALGHGFTDPAEAAALRAHHAAVTRQYAPMHRAAAALGLHPFQLAQQIHHASTKQGMPTNVFLRHLAQVDRTRLGEVLGAHRSNQALDRFVQFIAPYEKGGWLYNAIHHHSSVRPRHNTRLHGIVSLGSKIGDFFAQFDPTWPKAKFGGVIRKALVMAGGALGIPVGPIIDGMANLGHGAVPHIPPIQVAFVPPPPPPLPPPDRRAWLTHQLTTLSDEDVKMLDTLRAMPSLPAWAQNGVVGFSAGEIGQYQDLIMAEVVKRHLQVGGGGAPIVKHKKKAGFFSHLTKTEKIAGGVGGAGLIGFLAWKLLGRKKNPRKRRRSSKGRRR